MNPKVGLDTGGDVEDSEIKVKDTGIDIDVEGCKVDFDTEDLSVDVWVPTGSKSNDTGKRDGDAGMLEGDSGKVLAATDGRGRGRGLGTEVTTGGGAGDANTVEVVGTRGGVASESSKKLMSHTLPRSPTGRALISSSEEATGAWEATVVAGRTPSWSSASNGRSRRQ